MKAWAAAAAVLILAMSAQAQLPADSPLRASNPVPAAAPPWQAYLVPALESATINLSLLAFSNLVTQMPFALVTPQTLQHNLQLRAWTFDVDYYVTNQFGHAYQGALYFNAARSSGLSFWWAAAYTTLSSLTWELFFEAEPPSVNDQITTPLGGALLGEALHRAALQLRETAQPRWLGFIAATVLDPLGALNGVLLADPFTAGELVLDPMFMRWQFGASAGVVVNRATQQREDRSPPQALIAVMLVSGGPWHPNASYHQPLSYFDVRADLSFPRKVVGNLFIRGLLTGQRFGKGGLKGVWGLFGDYDYAAPAIVRASAVGLGPGFILQYQISSTLFLQSSAMIGVSPFAAAGQLLDVSPDLGRDYHVGPGLQSMVDLRVLRPGWFQLEFSARHWLVVGVYTPPYGFESIVYGTFAATVPIWRWLGVGAEATLSDRRAAFTDDGTTHDTGIALRVTLSVMTEPHFGIRTPAR